MSEMFTKCNGFIVSGDPLVYADSATMTGQGTVSEPFGVKSTDLFVQEPLYTGTSGNSAYIGWNNETVLYTGVYNSTVTSVTLSEPTTNFETVKVYWQHQSAEKAVFEYAGDSKQWYAIGGRYATPNNVPCIFQCFWTGNYNNYEAKFCNYQFGSLTAAPQAANELVPIKIVGINRKA